jgi:hypothetical protein
MTYNPNSFTTPTTSRATSKTAYNNSGSTIVKGTPVRLTANGFATINVSVESDVDAIAGVIASDASVGSAVEIISSGSVSNLSTSFSIGDALYIGTSGSLTNIKPTAGFNGFVAGDFVIRIGVLVANSANPSLFDLLVFIQNMGQL